MSEKQVEKKEKKPFSETVCKVPTSVGNKIHYTYVRKYDEERKKFVVVKGDPYDIDELIQESKSASDFAMLKERLIKLGEIPAVDPNIQYGVDEVLLPGDIHELNDLMVNGQANFQALPADIQAAFGNDYQAYVRACMNGSMYQVIAGYYANKPVTDEKKEGE